MIQFYAVVGNRIRESHDIDNGTTFFNLTHGQNLGEARYRISEYKKDGEWQKKHIVLDRLLLGVRTNQNTVFAITIVRDGVYKHVQEENLQKDPNGDVFYEIVFDTIYNRDAGAVQTNGSNNCLRVVEMVLEDSVVKAVVTEHAIVVQNNALFYTCQEVGRWRLYQDSQGIYTPDRTWPEFESFLTDYLPDSIKEWIAAVPRLPEHGAYTPPLKAELDVGQGDIAAEVKRWNHPGAYGILQIKNDRGEICDLRVSFSEITDSEPGTYYDLRPGQNVLIKSIWLSEDRFSSKCEKSIFSHSTFFRLSWRGSETFESREESSSLYDS
jgi:hypothetical protein